MITVNEIAELVEGKVEGDGNVSIKGMAPLAFAKEGDITFALSAEDLKKAAESPASCILTVMETPSLPKTLLRVKDPKISVTILYNAMQEIKPPQKGIIHPSAAISKSANLGKNVSIGANSAVGDNARIGDDSVIESNCSIGKNVTIGNRSLLYPNVSIYENVVIGNSAIIHSGAVIGADGYGFIPKDGKNYKVPQLATVIIEDDVEIGANTCIDRGTFTNTVIGRGTKIDNLVQVAHNIKIGKNVLIAGQTGIAGSTTIGDNTMMGGQVGISDHVKVGKNVKIGAKAGVSGRVADGETIMRNPGRSVTEAMTLDRISSMLIKHAAKFRKFLRNLPEE